MKINTVRELVNYLNDGVTGMRSSNMRIFSLKFDTEHIIKHMLKEVEGYDLDCQCPSYSNGLMEFRITACEGRVFVAYLKATKKKIRIDTTDWRGRPTREDAWEISKLDFKYEQLDGEDNRLIDDVISSTMVQLGLIKARELEKEEKSLGMLKEHGFDSVEEFSKFVCDMRYEFSESQREKCRFRFYY